MRRFASTLFIALCAAALLAGCATCGDGARAPQAKAASDAPQLENVEVSGSIHTRVSHYSGPARFRRQ